MSRSIPRNGATQGIRSFILAVQREEIGYFRVAVTSTLATMVLTNLGYEENAPPGTTAGAGAQVSPAGMRGIQGPAWVLTQPLGISLGGTGQADPSSAFTALSPLTR